ncbi:hypothetical protein GCM10025868_28960 [Angustibacter aerolatus]|uniref:Uncharacterized protein n=1 Tax=Angustibacter aerolatus TaxID=1162965 RepID=A0ABQ6JJA7_9ACTN|nr:hypothetical protein GCM10025868_28960 [Angustibacter aerolatus]
MSPTMIDAMARPRRSGATREAAASAATPRYAPCGRPATKRAAVSQASDGASAEATFAAATRPIATSSSRRRGTRAPSTASAGAPSTTPTAYADTSRPAAGSPTPNAAATDGSTPIDANSPVPRATPPRASAGTAHRARPTRRADVAVPGARRTAVEAMPVTVTGMTGVANTGSTGVRRTMGA